MQLRTEAAHEEGGVRDWSIATTGFSGVGGEVKKLHAVRVGAAPRFEPVAGSDFTIEADLILIAMGFLGPVKAGMIEQLGVALDTRGNVKTDAHYMSSVPGVFAAGDMRRGQSLVVVGDCRRPQGGCGGGCSPDCRYSASGRRHFCCAKKRDLILLRFGLVSRKCKITARES